MIIAGIAFSVGVVSLQLLPSLPEPSWLLLSFLLLPLFYIKPLRPFLWLISGLVWACFIANLHLDDRLSHDIDGKTVLLEAEIIGLPKQSAGSVRFVVQTDRHASKENRLPKQLRLSWFHGPKNIAPGQRWRLLVKLKRPHGFQNPGGFDYEQWLLTPHVGEAASLLDCTTADIQQDRAAAITQLQQQYGGVIVLKGAGSLVFDGGEDIFVCNAGNPGMASGGMGDVLTGVIAGLIAQGLTLIDAAKLGVMIHAMAGDCAAKKGEKGLIASDLMQPIRELINDH